MKIDRNNFEQYLKAFQSGTLSESEMLAFCAFLENHPDLIELPTLEKYSFHLSAAFKKNLKKTSVIHKENETDWFIRNVENELNEDEKSILSVYINTNNSAKETHDLFLLTKLSPDAEISYPNNNSLKKPLGILVFKTRQKIAAVFLAVVSSSILFFNLDDKIPETASLSPKESAPSEKIEPAPEIIAPLKLPTETSSLPQLTKSTNKNQVKIRTLTTIAICAETKDLLPYEYQTKFPDLEAQVVALPPSTQFVSISKPEQAQWQSFGKWLYSKGKSLLSKERSKEIIPDIIHDAELLLAQQLEEKAGIKAQQDECSSSLQIAGIQFTRIKNNCN